MLPVVLAGMAAVGAGISIYGQIKAAQDKEEAAQFEAYLKGLQADEMMSREAINEGIMRDEAFRSGLAHQAAFSGTGREGGGIGGILTIKETTDRNIQLARRDAEFKASMLRKGADMDQKLASDLMTSGYIGAAGTLLTSSASLYGSYSNYGKPSGDTKGLYS
jgi:hypothetical protein